MDKKQNVNHFKDENQLAKRFHRHQVTQFFFLAEAPEVAEDSQFNSLSSEDPANRYVLVPRGRSERLTGSPSPRRPLLAPGV